MKKLCFLALAIFASVYITSCSSDSSPTTGNEEVAEQQNALEENKTPVSILEEGIAISGAVKETGTPPTPTGNLDFQVNSELKTGFQGSGFEIKFSSNDNVAGAYIRFKDSDGNATDSYYDVPSSSFSNRVASRNSNFKSTLALGRNSVSSRTDDETTINVNLENTVPAGEFCYEICIYDENNNISQIQTVCVTIEAWGGNASIVGEWVPENSVDGENTEIRCANGNTITVDYEELVESIGYLSFKEDGSFEDHFKLSFKPLDYDATSANCSPVYQDLIEEEYKGKGNWAFNEDDNSLTVIYFSLSSSDGTEFFEFGDVIVDGLYVKEVTSDVLVLEFRNDFIDNTEIRLRRR